MRLQPFCDKNKHTGNYSIENDGLKQLKIQKRDKESTRVFRNTYGTNQNLILRSRNGDIYSTRCQDKSVQEPFHEFTATIQLEHTAERRHLRQ